MRPSRLDLVSMGLVITAFVAAIVVYPSLPAQMPTHWDAAGHVDKTSARAIGAFALPFVMLAVSVLLSWLPTLAVRSAEANAFLPVYRVLTAAFLLFLLCAHLFVLVSAGGAPLTSSQLVWPALGLMVAFLGDFVRKVQRNSLLAIRTPWTLGDEQVWARTHRLAGRIMMVSGIVLFALGFVRGVPLAVRLLVLLASGLVPAAYSYVIYRRLHAA